MKNTFSFFFLFLLDVSDIFLYEFCCTLLHLHPWRNTTSGARKSRSGGARTLHLPVSAYLTPGTAPPPFTPRPSFRSRRCAAVCIIFPSRHTSRPLKHLSYNLTHPSPLFTCLEPSPSVNIYYTVSVALTFSCLFLFS